MNYHVPVMLAETMASLRPRSGAVYVDGTLGGGGHAEAILRASAPDGRVVGFDWDEEAIAASRARLREWDDRIKLVRANFGEMCAVLLAEQVDAVDGVLLDLGVSSRQFDEASRGFSFQQDGPLDMRMSRSDDTPTAAAVIARAEPDELARIFFEYGEERRSRAIARRLVEERQRQPIETTAQLVRVIERVLGPKRGRIHPATRVFQALRIHVNRELDNLRAGLTAATAMLVPGGRLVVISFHSLEDRIVKWFFRGEPSLQIVTRKPLMADEAEAADNPRARSAKLRVAEKI